MYKNRIVIASVALITMIVLFGCTKYPDLYDSERTKDISVTFYDTSAVFKFHNTYSIVDTVGKVSWDEDGDTLVMVASTYSKAILDKINANMASLGYTKVDTSAGPDYLINAHTLTLDVEYVGYSGYYPYYGYGSSYYWGYPSYGYYYPYSYPYTYTETYGTVSMEIVDAKNRNEQTHQLRVVWTGMVVGGVSDVGNISTRISEGIDECFAQSPYLAQ